MEESVSRIETAKKTGAAELDLKGLSLTELPTQLFELTQLKTVDLSENKLTKLPPELAKLANLERVNLDKNSMSLFPEILLELKRLNRIDLGHNQLTGIPSGINRLQSLESLALYDNQISSLPPSIGDIKSLRRLSVTRNRLPSLPKELGNIEKLRWLAVGGNKLREFPEFIASLRDLDSLFVWGVPLKSFPELVFGFEKLRTLNLQSDNLLEIPPGIQRLSNLRTLHLGGNRLTALPAEIGTLGKLRSLNIDGNHISHLPPEIGKLENLEELDASNNWLGDIPPQIGNCHSLRELDITENQIETLPKEFCELRELRTFKVADNPFSIPTEIDAQGITAVCDYLRERLEDSSRQWVSKLLLVGEGGVGKTSLLRSLRGEEFNAVEATTHGIGVAELSLPYPDNPDVVMKLNTWDFGGQEIYHATHQFFLTDRSLFLLAWNARLGFEQGKLYYWLDTIQALAPHSPILIVSTHTDERDPDLPMSDLRRRYPQISGKCDISSKTGGGIKELKDEIAKIAAGLPLMGEVWPTRWHKAAVRVREMSENYITPRELRELIKSENITGTSADVLAKWLHDLGDIVYFHDSEELNQTIILKPQWLTEQISKVLESDEVVRTFGMFTKENMQILWGDVDAPIRDHFLRLMERFDLSYRTLENRDISLVVERLSHDAPDFTERWDAIAKDPKSVEISMKFVLNTIPAGIPTWFIARSHRFTTRTHWRRGVLLQDNTDARHLALVQVYPHERFIKLSVRGPHPHNFFALLMDGIEVALARFPGLKIDRKIPCPCNVKNPCGQDYDYQQLQNRINKRPSIECPKSLDEVSVGKMLFGMHPSTHEQILAQIGHLASATRTGNDLLLTELRDLRALTQRRFTSDFRREQSKIETACPNVFILRFKSMEGWKGGIKELWSTMAGPTMELQLLCQYPGEWHPAQTGGVYDIEVPAKWLCAIGPYVKGLVSVLRTAAPLLGPAAGMAFSAGDIVGMKDHFEFMSELVKDLPEIPNEDASAQKLGELGERTPANGAALRAVRVLLEQKDPAQYWGDLRKVFTPEGHYLWLCKEHAKHYS